MTVHVAGAHPGPETRPPALAPIDLAERGSLIDVTGVAVSASLPAHIAQRMANRAKNVLVSYQIDANVTPRRVASPGPGAYLFLRANYERSVAGFTSLGERGKPSEKVAEEACQELRSFHAGEAAVDQHLADQLLLPMALASDSSSMTAACITQHLLTNAHVIQKFLPVQIRIRGSVGAPGAVDVSPITES
jgi:RNA 3'-terminal phosphate cyclase (ATP)